MTDDPFAAFKENQPPTTDVPKPAKEKKRKIPPKKTASNGKAKEAAPAKPEPPKTTVLQGKPKKTRKPRQAKELRLPISTLLEIGSLSEEESGALLSIGAGLQKLPKKSRQRIAAALGKIFG